MERFGLPESVVEQILTVLAQCPAIDRAMVYGSRAMGTQKPGSDIDISLMGTGLTEADLLRLENQLDDLLLPYTFDLNRFAALQNQQLIEHILRVGQVLFQRNHDA